ncbi:5'-nucleotidase C-terminal domain-containing protein [Salisediminibacterium selenitireducens]|uniref:5'-Nucleotidase domain protein n=1 Tax=Bacillus selenitireducens (strain ATCC 700615 / DSM 15326 / MLS10) TaxID=439292 RepID=D6Y0Y1_BACIE|nr:5'-nucleotidase C-terminal domain-containing protein [Salisediminibacterium selenitireducens]ADH98585.1 5'-Nucleotidase domain protein [[Bacillus] selenitireducens MLS10]
MAIRKSPCIFGRGALIGSGTTALADEEGNGDTFKLDVLHTNDIHSKIDNFGKLSGLIDDIRSQSENSLYVDAGDIFSGSPVVDLQYGEPIIALLNEMGLDVMTIGNHEFDYGQNHLQDRIEQSEFPWIGANMEVIEPTHHVDQPDPYEIFEFDDVSVGIFGMTQAPPATRPAGIIGMEFHDYVETALEYEYLADEVDILIAVNHIGLSADQALAEEVEFFDAIIGGHSHTRITEPRMVNGTPIVQAGSDANYLGHSTFTLDKETGDVSFDFELNDVREVDESMINETVDAMVQGYLDEAEEILSEVIGHTNTGLNRNDRWEMDVSLGNFWTDSMRNALGTDIAFTNNGGIRANIAAGDITANDIYTTEPFGNEITEIEMVGHDLVEVIEHSYTRSADSFGYQVDLQVSGAEYIIYYNEDETFAGVDFFIDGEPMDMDETYSIAINNFMYEGGDGYEMFAETSELIQEAAGYVAVSMFQYVEELMETEGAVDYAPTEGRIQMLPVDEMTIDLPFTDILENNWAFDYVAHLYGNGIVNGTTETTFSPARDVTRGEFAALVTRSLGLEVADPDGDAPFSDLGATLGSEITAAYDAGLVQGHLDGTFRETASITREEMAVIAARAYEHVTGEDVPTLGEHNHPDFDQVAAFAVEGFGGMIEVGLFEGNLDGELMPKANTQRSEAAKVVYYMSQW